MPSIKKNILYSSILTTANYVFPLLTYPYVSRVLGVEKIGLCNFVDSIINYFILFSMMGINIVGIREIAKKKNDQESLDKTFSSLFILNSITTTIMLVILIITILSIPKLYENKELLYIGILKLIFNYLLIEWFYKGLEDFKYITIRTIIVKSLYVASVFLFVRNANDYKIYYFIMSMMIVFNAIINIYHSRKFINLNLKKIELKRYLKPFIILGVYSLLTSMYTSFNVAFLGFVSNESEVGYYTTATKLHSIILALFTAFTGVMLPRMSSLVAENKFDEFRNLFNKSVNILFGFSIPIIIFTFIFSSEIILLISGNGYEGAIIPMQIVMPLVLIIGYEQILIIQVLMPLGKDKPILINSIVGASVGILSNILLVPLLKSIGSSLVWLISELSVLNSAQYFISKNIKIGFPLKLLIKSIIFHIPLALFLFLISDIDFLNMTLRMFLGFIIMVIYCFILQYNILKNSTFKNLIIKITKSSRI